jgi:Xaa-Pro aminopeptidase
VLKQVQTYFNENGIQVRDYNRVDSDVSLLAFCQLNDENKTEVNTEKISDDAEKQLKGEKIWIDPGSCCLALFAKLSANQVFSQQSPLALAKALKVICTCLFSSSMHCPCDIVL